MSKAICSECGDIIESKHRHDFVVCKCGKAFLDGGDSYLRGNEYTKAIEFKGESIKDKDD